MWCCILYSLFWCPCCFFLTGSWISAWEDHSRKHSYKLCRTATCTGCHNWSCLETYTSSSIVLGNELLVIFGEASLMSMIISCWFQSAHGNQNLVLVIYIFIILIRVMVKILWWICQLLLNRQHYLLAFHHPYWTDNWQGDLQATLSTSIYVEIQCAPFCTPYISKITSAVWNSEYLVEPWLFLPPYWHILYDMHLLLRTSIQLMPSFFWV